eukprot:gene2152-3077_t
MPPSGSVEYRRLSAVSTNALADDYPEPKQVDVTTDGCFVACSIDPTDMIEGMTFRVKVRRFAPSFSPTPSPIMPAGDAVQLTGPTKRVMRFCIEAVPGPDGSPSDAGQGACAVAATSEDGVLRAWLLGRVNQAGSQAVLATVSVPRDQLVRTGKGEISILKGVRFVGGADRLLAILTTRSGSAYAVVLGISWPSPHQQPEADDVPSSGSAPLSLLFQ